jgi:FixJ family two-component response regulator
MKSRRWHIVAVDDDPGMRQAMEQRLLAAGFEVTTFASAGLLER